MLYGARMLHLFLRLHASLHGRCILSHFPSHYHRTENAWSTLEHIHHLSICVSVCVFPLDLRIR